MGAFGHWTKKPTMLFGSVKLASSQFFVCLAFHLWWNMSSRSSQPKPLQDCQWLALRKYIKEFYRKLSARDVRRLVKNKAVKSYEMVRKTINKKTGKIQVKLGSQVVPITQYGLPGTCVFSTTAINVLVWLSCIISMTKVDKWLYPTRCCITSFESSSHQSILNLKNHVFLKFEHLLGLARKAWKPALHIPVGLLTSWSRNTWSLWSLPCDWKLMQNQYWIKFINSTR